MNWLYLYELLGTNQRTVLFCYKDTTPFIAALFTIARKWRPPGWVSTDGWEQRRWYLCTVEFSLMFQKSEFMKFVCEWVELGR